MLTLSHEVVIPTEKLKHCTSSVFVLLHSRSSSSITIPTNFQNLSPLLQGHLSLPQLLQIHAHIFQFGAHQHNLIATLLIAYYISRIALRVFHQLQKQNTFPLNTIITFLAQKGHFLFGAHFCPMTSPSLSFSRHALSPKMQILLN